MKGDILHWDISEAYSSSNIIQFLQTGKNFLSNEYLKYSTGFVIIEQELKNEIISTNYSLYLLWIFVSIKNKSHLWLMLEIVLQ